MSFAMTKEDLGRMPGSHTLEAKASLVHPNDGGPCGGRPLKVMGSPPLSGAGIPTPVSFLKTRPTAG